MKSEQRKRNSEKLLASLGVRLRDELPAVEEENALVVRSAQDVAKRILILAYLNCVASDQSLRQQVMVFLIHEKLWDSASEEEKALFHKSRFTEEDLTVIFWRSEAIWALLWVINKVDMLDLPETEVDPYKIFQELPEFFESTEAFIQTAILRSVSEIFDHYDFIFRLNWALRQEQTSTSHVLDPGIVHERYVAVNWVVHNDEPWQQ